MRLFVAGALVAVLFGPATVLIGLGVLMNPAVQAACLTTTNGMSVATVPDHLETATRDGIDVRLDRRQLTQAATIIRVGGEITGVGRDGVTVALMAALTESRLRMLANEAAYPSSRSYPHDGDGGDHDSLGLFQMRPSTGWGTVAELMDPAYQARAFFGGPSRPNHGSPRGLLDIDDWTSMSKSAAAQAVEVSAFPDRYATWEPVAEKIINVLTTDEGRDRGRLAETSRVVFPLPAGTSVRSSGFGMRRHPITGVYKLHTGADYAAKIGTPILAAADGRVVFAGPSAGYGNLILIEHTVDSRRVASGYAHMGATGIGVHVGDHVTAGQQIAEVGMAGYTTGAHLHLEVRPGGAHAAPIDPEPWLAAQGASTLDEGSSTTATNCSLASDADAATFTGDEPDQLVDDPTSDGQINARTAHVLAHLDKAFPESSWACWRAGSSASNDHSAGRACDGTFGNRIGIRATGTTLERGWRAATWLKTDAGELGVAYLIWQGRIWSVARSGEGWRPYDGGGMFDPRSVTGGHFDHLHVSVAR